MNAAHLQCIAYLIAWVLIPVGAAILWGAGAALLALGLALLVYAKGRP